MKLASLALSALAGLVAAVPEQIHLSLTGLPGQLAVDFVTSTQGVATVEYGFSANALTSNATSLGSSFPTIGYLHTALMEGIAPASTLYYRVVDAAGDATGVFAVPYEVPREGGPTYAVFADFGYANDESMAELVQEAQSGRFDYIIHAGDIAYNLDSDNSAIGNSFMNLAQGYAATVPYMLCPGNHEEAGNFTQYMARFAGLAQYAGTNSGSGSNLYYSFEVGPVHFLAFSSEVYLYSPSAAEQQRQLDFMEADLAAVNSTKTPWKVAFAHKCSYMANYTGFGPILEKYGVDMLFCGHVHHYRRFQPYNPVTNKGYPECFNADKSVCTNAKAMVSIVTGAAGNHEGESTCANSKPTKSEDLTVTCSSNYGFGVLQVANATHLHWTFDTTHPDGTGPADYKDDFWLVKTA